MIRISYHFFEDDNSGFYQSNRVSNKRPLLVNCTGCFKTESEFTTNVTGRVDYYLIYIYEGCLEITMNNSLRRLMPGELIVFPPNTPYYYKHTDNSELTYLWVHFTGSNVEDILGEYGIEAYPSVIQTNDDGSVSSAFRAILDAAANRDDFTESELSLSLNKLLLIIGRKISDTKSNGLFRSISYINSHYNNDLRIPMLAKIENLSVSRYNAVFTSQLGISPMQYIIKTRLNIACDLLKNTDLSIKEIASLVGYEDPHFFSRLFKSHLKHSPLQYRKI